MATNVHYQAGIFLFCCVMLSAGLQVEVKRLKYCGPPDKTLKYKVSPWPVITAADSVKVTATFTPARDIFSLSFFVNITKDGKTIIERNKELNCNYVPYHCYFSADAKTKECVFARHNCLTSHFLQETYTLTRTLRLNVTKVPSTFKGKLGGTFMLFNQEQFCVFCAQAVVVVS